MARNKIIGSILSILVILIIISLISGVIASDKTSNKIVDKKYDTITAYGLDMPEVGQKAGVTVSSQIKEKLQTDKKVRAIVTMKEPKAVKGWSKKVATMKTSQVKELKNAARESAINNIDRQRVKHKYNSFNGFSASLTQEEFNDLIASGMVESIEYDEPFYISLQDSTGIINATESWSLQYDGVNLTGAGQTVCVIDTGVDYTHPDLGGCTIENVTLDGNIVNYSEESEHPYEDNKTVTYKINYTGFDSIAVHFSQINLEPGWDFIYILDGNNNTITNYTGFHEDLWSPHIEGDTIYVKLVADDFVNETGFYIDKIINGTTSTTYNWSNCSKVISGYDFLNDDPNPEDDKDHGTHCAGIVAANGGIKGVAPDAKIVAIKACDNDALGTCYTAEIIKGIEYCTDNAAAYNISIISMSLGGGGYNDYCDSSYPGITSAINSAVAKNISVIIAAGNDGYSDKISGPGCIQNATPVGATEKNDSFADYSNRNELVQLFAPGTSINSTWYPGGGYNAISGTSMATPHVAGAFAIINQYLKLSGQSKTPQEIESIFNGTGKQIYDSASDLTYGRINLYEALLDAGYVEVTIVSPEADTITEVDYIFINMTSNEDLNNVTLHIINPSQNISMDGSGTSWYYNLSGNGSITFFVTAKDADENQGQSENRTIFLNNSAPNITQTSPATEINISEPNNQTFSINYTDDSPSLLIEWYLNSSLIADETTEWNFTGNYSSAGSYNITVIINDSILSDKHSWVLNVNDTNKPLHWLHTFPNLTLEEDSTIIYDINASDEDNDTTYYANNNVSINSSTGLINFTPAQDWNGTLVVTFTASDGIDNITGEILFNVTPVNDAPVLHLPNSIDLDEDKSTTIAINITDVDNIDSDINWSCSSNETNVSLTQTNISELNITASDNFNGFANITCIASDQELNNTAYLIVNVTPLNDAPQFTLTYNAAYNETETINITVNATDIDNDNLTYGINDTKFTNINDSFIWNTTYQDSGDHYFKVNVSDGNQVTETVINITILEIEDVDNDGINDTEDYLVGEADTIISNISLNISIGNLTNLSQEFNGIHEINISYNTSSLLEFNWNFTTQNILNMSAITIEKQPTSASSGYLLVKGLNLISQASTKTIYVAKLNTSIPSICIKDAEIESINNISSFCNEDDETPITCPGSSGDYNCNLSDDNNTFVITGLSHSGVRQQTYCGDGIKDADEECDGSNFGSETCITKGYDLGTLNCNSDCIISTTSCSNRYTGGGGGGGGGGSTAVATVPSGPKYSRYFSYLGAGVLEIPIANLRIPLRNFKLRTTEPNNRVSFVFQRVDDISFIENPLRNAYHYMRIEAEGIDNTTISSISFEFNINKSWFDSQYNKDKVYLERYYNNVWEKHTARFLKEVNNTYLYKAEANGMSYFAITAEQVIIERPAPEIMEEEERIKEREAVIEKAEEVPSEPASEEIPGVIEVEEEKGPGFFSRSWEKFSNLIERNIIVTLLVIIVLALLGGTGFNMYYYYISTLKQGEDDGSEEDYEEEKKQKQNKAKDKAVGTAKNEHVNDWAQRHAKKGFSIDEIKGALVSRGFRDEDIDKIIFSLGEKPGKNKFIKKIGNIKKKVKSLTSKFHK